MVMRAWIWVSSVRRYLGAEGGERLCTLSPSLCHFPSLSHSHLLSLLHFSQPFLWLSACHSSPSLSVLLPSLPPSYRFESSLNVDALTPRYSGIGETVAGAATARDIHTLAPQVPEGLCYHQDGIVGQSWSVLYKEKDDTLYSRNNRKTRTYGQGTGDSIFYVIILWGQNQNKAKQLCAIQFKKPETQDSVFLKRPLSSDFSV